jgi:glycosyltransferase involved in cell wall biosynthesis
LLAGIPTIAGEVGGLPEVVHRGLTGEVVPVRCPQILARTILNVREKQAHYKGMAESGRELVSVMFDPVRCAREILAIYRHILYGATRPDEFSPKDFLQFHQQEQTAITEGAS